MKSDIKLRKNRIVSDDEDEEEARPAPSKSKGRSRASVIKAAVELEAEASLRAMMDMDDCGYRVGCRQQTSLDLAQQLK